MKRALLHSTLMASCALIAASGCSLFRHPSVRVVHEFVRPDGTVIKCHEPPPDMVPASVGADLDAKIPDLVEVVNSRGGIEETTARIRSEIPNLQAVEAIEFRMCAAWAQGALDEEAYQRF